GDAPGDAPALFAHKLHGGCFVADGKVVVRLGNLSQFLAYVQTEQPRGADALGHAEVDVAVDDREAVVVGCLVELVQLPARAAFVEHVLPEVGDFARTAHIRLDRAGIDAPVSRAVYPVSQLGGVDLDTLLLLEPGAHRAETLPSRAALGHLLKRDGLR